MIRVVHPGTRIRMLTSTHPGSRIRNTDCTGILHPDPFGFPIVGLVDKGKIIPDPHIFDPNIYERFLI
jgi:hypothetical protein